MSFSFGGEAGFPKTLQSEAIFLGYVVTTVKVTLNSTGDLYFYIGTASSLTGEITWELITTFGSNVTLSNPNLVTYWKAIGAAGTTLSASGLTPAIEIEYIN